jgi:predicted DNA-binding antitoxin AbrB/MazE fold protein
MRQKIDAVYENGLFRPLEPLSLAEHERVSITVETSVAAPWLDQEALEWARQEGDPRISLEEVRARLAKVSGSLSELVIAERGEY